MIIMDIKIDNFFGFEDFHMNMAYPKKLVKNPLQDEFLESRTNFRYKKVNIIMGANATGKTTFGRMINFIFKFISMDPMSSTALTECIRDRNRQASFTIDFVPENTLDMYRVSTKIEGTTERYTADMFHVCVQKTPIGDNDDYEKCAEVLDKMEMTYTSNIEDELKKIPVFSWMMTYAEGKRSSGILERNADNFMRILEATLKAVDPSVEKVEMISNVENSYVIKMTGGGDAIVKNGIVVDDFMLSSGTKAAISISYILTWILNGWSSFYYCDERFTYLHSDIEKTFLSVMSTELSRDGQLFFTTHNLDILDMHFPKHTYTFLKKDNYSPSKKISCVYASDYLKKNTDSLRNAVENDLFSIAPDVEKIYELVED